jgi:DNA-binding GntR family transcriptional regulator
MRYTFHRTSQGEGGRAAERFGMSAAELKPLAAKPESLTQIVFDTIRDAIVSKLLPPGHRVSEVGLARQLQVSKTPVREALLRLHAIGLVEEADGGRGMRIVRPSRESIRHACEVRAALEALAARLAASRATATQRAHLVEVAALSLALARQDDVDGFRRHDQEFHDELTGASRNPYLVGLIGNAYTLAGALRQRDVPSASDSVECAIQHVAIAEAIARGDADAAAAATSAHVEKIEQLVLAAFLRATPAARQHVPHAAYGGRDKSHRSRGSRPDG